MKKITLSITIFLSLTCSTVFANTGTENNSHIKSHIEQFIVGGYTKKASEGINLVTVDTQNATFTETKVVAKANNPSYLALSHDHLTLYAVDEDAKGNINQFHWDVEKGMFTRVYTLKDIGAHPCHIAISPNGKNLSVSNYSSGNSKVFEVLQSSSELTMMSEFQSEGRSKHPRQEAPHLHWMNWDNNGNYSYSVDLGTDQVFVHYNQNTNEQYNDKNSMTKVAIKLQPSEGPRHMAFHPTKNVAYIINELSNTVVVVDQDVTTGLLTSKQRISILPEQSSGNNYAAAIKLSSSGKHLYVSIRGSNLIGVFDILDDGTISIKQHIKTDGDWPRDLTLSQNENLLLVANERSNSLTLFKRDINSGLLTNTKQEITLPKPTFITPFAPK